MTMPVGNTVEPVWSGRRSQTFPGDAGPPDAPGWGARKLPAFSRWSCLWDCMRTSRVRSMQDLYWSAPMKIQPFSMAPQH